MRGRLPYTAVLYIATTTLLAFMGVLDILVQYPLHRYPSYLFPLVLIVASLAGRKRVALTSGKANNATQISLGFIVDLIVLLTFGPSLALLSNLASMLAPYCGERRQALYQLVFNLSASSLTTWILSRCLWLLDLFTSYNQLFITNSSRVIGPVLFSTLMILVIVLLHLAINALLVTGAVSLSMGWPRNRALSFLRNNTLWPAPTYLAAGCFMVMVVWITRNLEHGLYSAAPLCFVMVPQPLLYLYNLRLHRERDLEKERRFDELESLYSSMVQAMGRAIEAKDRYTQEHIARVVAMSLAIGKRLSLPEEKLRTLEVGAALHDIGKIAIPDTILNKPGKLTNEEFELIKEHAALGSEILQPVPFPPEVVEAVRHHHEKWDGTGYPDQLLGEQIPLMARIVAVADVYDALTSDRPYRAAWSHERAMTFMSSQVGTHFNPRIFAAFEEAMEADPSLQSKADHIELP